MKPDLFIDSSALVALLLGEDGWEAVADELARSKRLHTSPLVMLETVMVVSTRIAVDPEIAEHRLLDLLHNHDVAIVAIDEEVAHLAVRAFARYGKGRHAARLNLGDCFSYACAKRHRLALLYKGDDFANTNLG